MKCVFTGLVDDATDRQKVYDQIWLENGSTKVNKLDSKVFSISDEKLTKFLEHYEDSILNTKRKGKSYMIMDNFMEYFGLTKEDLLGARAEAQALAKEAGQPASDYKRVDVMTWLNDIRADPGRPSLAKLDSTMETFRNKLNQISQVGEGDRSKRVDKSYFQISLHNGASGVEHSYHIH